MQVEEELILSQVDSLKIEDSNNDLTASSTCTAVTTPNGDKENNNPGLNSKSSKRRERRAVLKKAKKKQEELSCTYCNLSFNERLEFQVWMIISFKTFRKIPWNLTQLNVSKKTRETAKINFFQCLRLLEKRLDVFLSDLSVKILQNYELQNAFVTIHILFDEMKTPDSQNLRRFHCLDTFYAFFS